MKMAEAQDQPQAQAQVQAQAQPQPVGVVTAGPVSTSSTSSKDTTTPRTTSATTTATTTTTTSTTPTTAASSSGNNNSGGSSSSSSSSRSSNSACTDTTTTTSSTTSTTAAAAAASSRSSSSCASGHASSHTVVSSNPSDPSAPDKSKNGAHPHTPTATFAHDQTRTAQPQAHVQPEEAHEHTPTSTPTPLVQAQSQAHVYEQRHHDAVEHQKQQEPRQEEAGLENPITQRLTGGPTSTAGGGQEAGQEFMISSSAAADETDPTSAATSCVPSTYMLATTSTVTTDPTFPISPPVLHNGALVAAHGQQQNDPTPLSPSSATAMSNPPHHPGHPRPPVGFPSPTYSSPGFNAHYGYANPPGQPGDPYRSPGPPGNAHPMSLPSMRTFDPVQQQQAQQVPMAQQMMQAQSSMPSSMAQAPGMAYYPQPVPLPGNPYTLPPEAMGSRYALPPTDPRSILGNPRNKKEIKRRTKTGCLTCRKRRIKCDEQHPICKNCQKSKRECLGYDPIFKQQQQHPTTIQPAPNHPAPPASVPSNGPAPPTPSSVPASAAAVPSAATPYGSLPPVLPSSYTPTASSSSNTPGATFEPGHPSTGPQHPHVKGEVFDYGAAIDPALDSVGAPPPSTSTPHLPPVNSVAPGASSPDWRPSNSTPSLRGGGPLLVSHVPASPQQPWIPAYLASSAKKMRIDELVSWGRSPAPKLPSRPTQATLDEIRSLYAEIYAPGLDAFFESKWFTLETTAESMMASHPVIDMLAGFLSIVGKADQNNKVAMNDSANLEFRVVWDLACLANTNDPRLNTPSTFPPCDDGAEVRHRVTVLDTLLSGGSLQENPLVRPPPQGDYQRLRELDFWYHIGEFLLVQPAEGQPTGEALAHRDQILTRLRTLLDGRENRDVLYSIAIMRALSPEFPADFESSLPPHLDESDPKSKLAVARKFIQDEAKVTGGTTNIVRRFSELASMAFINPGANVQWRR